MRLNNKSVLVYGFVIALIFGAAFIGRRTYLHNYFRGKKDLQQLERYLQTQPKRKYQVPAFVYIAHAGGGLDGKTYLNTLDAIENSVRKGVDYIEIDFHYTKDSVVIASHFFEDRSAEEFLKDHSDGTHLTLSLLLDWLAKNEVTLITDIKVDNIKILGSIALNHPHLIHRIIPQAYSIPEIIQIKKMGFENVIYTNYISRYPNSIIENLGATISLFAITMPYDGNFKRLKILDRFTRINTPVFTNTVNDSELIEDLIRSGCRGVYTDDQLLPSIR